MEQMRNHLQHRGFPLNVTLQMRNVKTHHGSKFRFAVKATIGIKSLEDDRKFKKAIVSELRSHGGEVDARHLCAEYVGGIGRVHQTIRGMLDEWAADWISEINNAISRYKVASGSENVTSLAVVESEKRGAPPTYINTWPFDYLKMLREKYLTFGRFEDRFLSSKGFDFTEQE
jgi:hypothetical protein